MTQILAVNILKNENDIFHALTEWDYTVRAVQTPAECRQALRTAEIDMVFLNLEPNEELLLYFRTIKESHAYLPIIGLTTLSKSKLHPFLDKLGITHKDFVNIFYPPLKVEQLVFALEDILIRDYEEAIESEKPLTEKERRQRLTARRRLLEDQRLSDFLSAHAEPDIF